MVTYSYNQLDAVIDNATTNTTGTVQWTGANGEKVILQQLNQRIRDFGVIYADAAQLPSLSGADGSNAIVKGVGIYRFSASVPLSPSPNDVIAGGGIWIFLGPLRPQSVRQTIGNGGGLSFQINHFLNCTTPHVSVYDASGGLPYSQITAWTVSIIDANSYTITFTSAPAGNGAIVATSL